MTVNRANSLIVFKRTRVSLIVSVILMLGLCVGGCSKQQVRLPVVVSQNADNQYHVGKFVWYDLYTDDLKATSFFYKKLFGWTFQTTVSGNQNVKTILRQGMPIANAIYTKPLKKNIKESRWLGYISVDDVDQVSGIAIENKGSIYIQPKEMPDRGRIAIIIDPQGAIFGVVKTTFGDPPDLGMIENHWIGSELWTTDLDSALVFYNLIAGYETREISIEGGPDYTFLMKNDQARAGLVKIVWERIQPDWLPYVAVENVMSVVDNAKQLGGKILVKPDTRFFEGHVAIIEDPSGAVFAVQQISDKHNKGEQ